MKKSKLILPVLAPAMVLAGSLLANNTYAAETGLRIDVTDSSSNTCEIYQFGVEPFNSLNAACEESYGSYDPETSTLTIGEGSNGKTVYIYGVSADGSVTVKRDGEIHLTELHSTRELEFDFESEAKDNMPLFDDLLIEEIVGDGEDADHLPGSFTLKSGDFHLAKSTTFADVVLEKGNLSSDDYITVDSIEIKKGASLNINNGSLLVNESAKVSGGSLAILGGESAAHAITLSGEEASFSMTDGTVVLEGANVMNSHGIGSNAGNKNGNQSFTISGGKISMKNYNYGIKFSRAGEATFNGGTATFEEMSGQAVLIAGKDKDLSKAISLGKDMTISEADSIYYKEGVLQNEAGIKGKGDITITKKAADDDEDAPGSAGDDEESDVKVPDTGTLEDAKTSGALSIFAASTFVLLSVIALATAHKKHAAGHFKFDNK